MAPTEADLKERIAHIDRQCHALLYLSALNMFLNATMLIISFLLSMS